MLGLEFEDLFVILGIAAVTNILGKFLHRELAGIPMNILFQYIVPLAAVPLLIVFKYGKPRRYLLDFLEHHTKPRVYCGIEPDSQPQIDYLKEDDRQCR
jgi:hypothetical protein